MRERVDSLAQHFVDGLKLWEEGYTSAEIGEMLGIPENYGGVAEDDDTKAAFRGTP